LNASALIKAGIGKLIKGINRRVLTYSKKLVILAQIGNSDMGEVP